jgi:hypothetical protein
MMTDKGIEGIAPDTDYIHKLLSPDAPKADKESINKKGPAKAFLVQLTHKDETRYVERCHLAQPKVHRH